MPCPFTGSHVQDAPNRHDLVKRLFAVADHSHSSPPGVENQSAGITADDRPGDLHHGLKKQPAKGVGKAPAKSKAGKLTKEEVGRLARPGESWEAAYARLNQIQLELS